MCMVFGLDWIFWIALNWIFWTGLYFWDYNFRIFWIGLAWILDWSFRIELDFFLLEFLD